MTGSAAKQEIFQQLATVAKAISHPLRLQLLEHLGQGERNVERLADLLGQSIANTSHHLAALRRSGLAATRKDGLHVHYRLAGDDVIDLLGGLRQSAERHNGEIARVLSGYFRDRDGMEPLSRAELVRRSRDGLVTILDVRPAAEFALGHLPGAINMPITGLGRRLKELPANREIIAYCRGAYCVYAFEAVAKLRQKGLNARRLEDGFPEWKAAGLPVEAGGECSAPGPRT